MDAAAIAALCTASVIVLGGVAKLVRVLYVVVRRIEDAIGTDDAGTTIRDRVIAVENTLNNGLRREIRQAHEESIETRKEVHRACVLAGSAAQAAATAQQNSQDATRGVNALRAEFTTITDAVLSDLAHLWTGLSSLGYDRRHADPDTQ